MTQTTEAEIVSAMKAIASSLQSLAGQQSRFNENLLRELSELNSKMEKTTTLLEKAVEMVQELPSK